MKELPINLDDLALQLERPRDMPFDVLLDVETGELVQLTRADFDEPPEEEAELRERVDAHPERYQEVPILGSHEAYRFMERFADSRPDEERRELLRALQGKGAFGRFRDAVSRARQDDEWHRFHEEQLELHVRQWLEGLGLTAPPTVKRKPVVTVPVAPAPVLPGLVQMLIFGGQPELRGDKVERVLEAPSPAVAQKYFAGIARSICAHIGEDWRKRFVENTNEFERERFLLRVEGKRVVLTVTVDPAIVKLFAK